ncbi:unnamed protein product, partial [Schistosoma guineensis]
MTIPELLTSNWRSFNIYCKGPSKSKKNKFVEILCAENSYNGTSRGPKGAKEFQPFR